MFCRQCGSQLPLAAPYCDVCGHQAADARQVRPLTQQTRPLPDDDFRTLLAVATPAKTKSYKWGWAAVAVLAVLAASLIATSIVLFVVWPPWGDQAAEKNERQGEKRNAAPQPTRAVPVYAPTVEPAYKATPQPT